MKIKCVAIGKTVGSYGLEEVQTYVKRIQHFIPFEFIELKEIKHNKHNRENALLTEEKSIVKHVSSRDALILFDEKGKQWTQKLLLNLSPNRRCYRAGHWCFVLEVPMGLANLYASVQKGWFHSPP